MKLFIEGVSCIKDFDAEQVERHAGLDPSTLEFKLGGRVLRRLPSFSPYVLTDFQSKEGAGMRDTIDYIKGMIDPSSHDEFELALRDGNPKPSMDTLMEMSSWLVEQASSRPTSHASSSSDGRNGTGTFSTVEPQLPVASTSDV